MNIERDNRILKYNSKMASIAHKKYRYLTKKSKNLWTKYGEKDDNGNMVIKSPKLVKIAVNIQKDIDEANYEELKYLLRGRIVWQGLV